MILSTKKNHGFSCVAKIKYSWGLVKRNDNINTLGKQQAIDCF